jgi:DUF1680 family protein
MLEVGGGFDLSLRIPAWCDGARVAVNDQAWSTGYQAGEYATLRHAWRGGDVVTLDLPMPARLVECHPHVSENLGHIAVMRGPLVYCVEQADNPSIDPRDVAIRTDAPLTAEHVPSLLNGVTVVRAKARLAAPGGNWNQLYRPLQTASGPVSSSDVELTFIPYYAWANREPGRMQVWLRRD